MATNEINQWISNNKQSNVTIQLLPKNKLIVTLFLIEHNALQITYPVCYPHVKTGFKCEYLTETKQPKFIQLANNQFQNKVLSITTVINHLLKALQHYVHFKNTTLPTTNHSVNVFFDTHLPIHTDTWQIDVLERAPPITDSYAPITDSYAPITDSYGLHYSWQLYLE